MLAFLRRDVEPLFAHLAEFGPAVRERLEAYRAALDPSLGTVYRQRRDYEESMTLVADTVSAYLDAEEELAQAMFPHYFERLRTDGVDHTIYVGGSLVESGEFDELYLRNLRLWQLMVTCGIARRTEAIRPRLTVPLATTHLVLAHHAPLSIRFRFDERRFDVEGAYNIRYEVIKKRIDKAVVRGDAGAGHAAGQAGDRLLPAQRGGRVPGLPRVPGRAGLRHRRGRGPRARGPPGRPRAPGAAGRDRPLGAGARGRGSGAAGSQARVLR